MTDILHDKFYTPDATARRCVGQLWRQVGIRADDLFIEPSAGAGAFCRHLPAERTIALDIAPEADGILTADFLQFVPPAHHGRRIVIGNPPFGRNGALARAFLRHATAFADVIVFILPASFAKVSMQRGIDRHFHLVHQTQLGAASFETCEGLRKVRTVLQIWEKRGHPRAEDVCLQAAQEDFEFVRDIRQADLVVRRVGVRAGAVLDVPPLSDGGALPSGYSASSNYYLKSKGCDPATLARRLQALDLAAVAAAAVCPSLSKQELVGAYAEMHTRTATENDAVLPAPTDVNAVAYAPACRLSAMQAHAQAGSDKLRGLEQEALTIQHCTSRRGAASPQASCRAGQSPGIFMRVRRTRHWQAIRQLNHPALRPGARQGVAPRPPDRPCARSSASVG